MSTIILQHANTPTGEYDVHAPRPWPTVIDTETRLAENVPGFYPDEKVSIMAVSESPEPGTPSFTLFDDITWEEGDVVGKFLIVTSEGTMSSVQLPIETVKVQA